MNDTDLAYAAGLFDGEGCVHISWYQQGVRPDGSPRRYHKLMVVMTNTDPRLLAKMQALFGGTIGNPQISKQNNKPYYRWQITGRRAAEALADLVPFLVCKRDQAEVGIAFFKTYTKGGAGNRISPEVAASRAAMASTLRVLKTEVG